MNEAIYKFRRYEESSLSYAGVNMHEGESVGLFSTTLSRADYDLLSQQQRSSIEPPARSSDDKPEPAVRATSRADEDDNEDAVDETEEEVGVPVPVSSPAAPAVELVRKQKATDVSGAVKGAKVRHKTLGEGIIDSITSQGQARYVSCILRGTKRMFPYPDIFIDGRLEIV